MPDMSRLNESTLASMLKGTIGGRHRYDPTGFEMPDDKMLRLLANWGKKAAIQASAMGGIGYSLHLTGSVSVMTDNYLRMEYCRKELGARGLPAQNTATLGKMALVGGIVVFIWGKWANQSRKASIKVVEDFAAHEGDYELDGDVYPFSPDVMKASVAPARRITGR